jgi:protein subunit release factor B
MTAKYKTDRSSMEADCEVDFFTASGPGGQHRNRSKTGVRLRHKPSGLIVTATELRSQVRNLEKAYDRLRKRLEKLNRPKKKRKRTRPSKAARERRLKTKAHRSRTKNLRRKPKGDE